MASRYFFALFTFGILTALFSENLVVRDPIPITGENSSYSTPGIAGNSSGYLVAYKDDSGYLTTQFTSDFGENWGSQTQLSELVTVDVTANVKGDTWMIAWVGPPPGVSSGEVYTSISNDNGSTWSSKMRVSTESGPGSLSIYDAQIGVNNIGYMVAWAAQEDENFYVWSNFSSDGINWNGPVQVSLSFISAGSEAVSVAGNSKGFLTLFTAGGGRSDDDLYPGYACFSSDNGATWGEPNFISNLTLSPAVGASEAGFLAAWRDFNEGNIRTSFSSDNGATWSEPVTIDLGGDSVMGMACKVRSIGGVFFVSWIQGSSPYTGYVIYSMDQGATWSAPVNVTLSEELVPGYSKSLDFAVTSSGALFGWTSLSDQAYSNFARLPFSVSNEASSRYSSSFRTQNVNVPKRGLFD